MSGSQYGRGTTSTNEHAERRARSRTSASSSGVAAVRYATIRTRVGAEDTINPAGEAILLRPARLPRRLDRHDPGESERGLPGRRRVTRLFHAQGCVRTGPPERTKRGKACVSGTRIVLQGWINYYGRFYKSMLYPVFRHLNETLVRWAMKKYKRLRRRPQRARRFIADVARRQPDLFAHWRFGVRPDGWTMGAR